MALAGICPILAMIFGSDDVESIKLGLSRLTPQDKTLLDDLLRDTLTVDFYPLGDSVWQFNDPVAEYNVLTTALGIGDHADEQQNAWQDLFASLDMLEDTFPFVSLAYTELDENSIIEFSEERFNLDSPAENPAPKTPPHSVGPEAVIIPSIAVGSLLLLRSKLNSTRGYHG